MLVSAFYTGLSITYAGLVRRVEGEVGDHVILKVFFRIDRDRSFAAHGG